MTTAATAFRFEPVTHRVDGRSHGIIPGRDCTKGLLSALEAATAPDAPAGKTGLWLPPGELHTEATLLPTGFAIRGLVLEGAALRGVDGGRHLGTSIVAHGLAGKPVIDLNGVVAPEIRNLAIFGGGPSDAPEKWAGFGVRLRSAEGTGGGAGRYDNIYVVRCDQGFNFGDGGIVGCAADMTLIDCATDWCRVGYRTEHPQAVNIVMLRCGSNFGDDALQFSSQGAKIMAFSTYDMKRLLYRFGPGCVSGVVEIDHAKLDGTAHRTVLYDTHPSLDIAETEFRNVTHIPWDQPAGTTPRMTLRRGQIVRMLGGGANLCGPAGRLFDCDGGGSIFIQGCKIPRDRGQVVGRVTGTGQYHVRDCFGDDYLDSRFIPNYSGGANAPL